MLNKGIEKLDRDLGIENVLEMIKRARVLVNLTLSKDENLLLKCQRYDVIDSSSDESSSDEDEDEE